MRFAASHLPLLIFLVVTVAACDEWIKVLTFRLPIDRMLFRGGGQPKMGIRGEALAHLETYLRLKGGGICSFFFSGRGGFRRLDRQCLSLRELDFEAGVLGEDYLVFACNPRVEDHLTDLVIGEPGYQASIGRC